FRLRVARFEVAELGSSTVFGAQCFAEAVGIIFDDGAGGVENALRGTVVTFEANDFCVGKIAREAEQNRDIRAAPAVDRLVFVPDHADILVPADQQAEQIVLYAIGILVFVYMNVLETSLPLFTNGSGIAEK